MKSAFGLVIFALASCGQASLNETKNAASKEVAGPFKQLANALISQDAAVVSTLTGDKIVYVRKERGSPQVEMTKTSGAKVIKILKSCILTSSEEHGEKMSGGSILVSCAPVTEGCGPSGFALWTSAELDKGPVKIEYQGQDANKCAPAVGLFAA